MDLGRLSGLGIVISFFSFSLGLLPSLAIPVDRFHIFCGLTLSTLCLFFLSVWFVLKVIFLCECCWATGILLSLRGWSLHGEIVLFIL